MQKMPSCSYQQISYPCSPAGWWFEVFLLERSPLKSFTLETCIWTLGICIGNHFAECHPSPPSPVCWYLCWSPWAACTMWPLMKLNIWAIIGRPVSNWTNWGRISRAAKRSAAPIWVLNAKQKRQPISNLGDGCPGGSLRPILLIS